MRQQQQDKRSESAMAAVEHNGQPAARYDFAAEKALHDLQRAGEACADCWRKLQAGTGVMMIGPSSRS